MGANGGLVAPMWILRGTIARASADYTVWVWNAAPLHQSSRRILLGSGVYASGSGVKLLKATGVMTVHDPWGLLFYRGMYRLRHHYPFLGVIRAMLTC